MGKKSRAKEFLEYKKVCFVHDVNVITRKGTRKKERVEELKNTTREFSIMLLSFCVINSDGKWKNGANPL